MYERFTDRARKVMHLADDEARRFGHDSVGPEHILLGLVKEGSGVAANVLKNLGVDLQRGRLEVERLHEAGRETFFGEVQQTLPAKRVVEKSAEEARGINHHYVGTEHLLLSVLHEQESVAAKALANLGVELDKVRDDVLDLLGVGSDGTQAFGIFSGMGSSQQLLDALLPFWDDCSVVPLLTSLEQLEGDREDAVAKQDLITRGSPPRSASRDPCRTKTRRRTTLKRSGRTVRR